MPNSFNEIENIKKRIVLENKLAFAFPTNIPVVPGHLLIVPKRTVKTFEELTPEETKAIFDLISKLKPVMKEVFGAIGFNHAWNEGASAGQNIPHLHIHLLPRKEDDEGIYEYEPRKFLYRPGSRAETPEKELIEIAELMKKQLLKNL